MRLSAAVLVFFATIGATASESAAQFPQQQPQRVTGPWSDSTLSPDRRAELLLAQMTLDEKIGLVHGSGMRSGGGSNGGAGYVPGIPRLGILAMQMADAVVGVTRGAQMGRYSTPFPSQVAISSSWDVRGACEIGAAIGDELFDQGYTMSLGGGVNITREPRNGRTFEYKGEDPILAGKLVASEMRCLQARGILGDIKHFAANDQETGRNIGNVILDERSLRETDLLPFEIALRETDISAVMCSYNKVNTDWACENSYLMNDFLKKAVGFKGFVVSDWGGTHSTMKAALAGLDMEEPGGGYFGDSLKAAVQRGDVPAARLDDMVKRILRSQFAVGQFDRQRARTVPNVFAGLEVAQRAAERGAVLLKNADHRLPLSAAGVRSIAIIGSHADVGVLSGGGSSQVDAPGGNPVAAAVTNAPAGGGFGRVPTWHPSSPLRAIQAKAPRARVTFDAGTDPSAAAAAARAAEVAILFVNQHTSEGRDVTSLTLPDNQDAVVAAVAAANPRTIVVLESGGAVTMPWIDRVSAVLAVWYPGIRGGEAIANLLFGDVNPSGKLVLTFPKSQSDLPHASVFGPAAAVVSGGGSPATPAGGVAGGRGSGRGAVPPFDIPYTERLKVGYKWYDAEGKAPLFAFGHGLSYTTYAYSGLHVEPGTSQSAAVVVSFTVKNTGKRAGREIAQVYASLPASTGEPPKRLIAWDVIDLDAGESKTVRLAVDPLFLSVFDTSTHAWRLSAGQYTIRVGGSSAMLPLSSTIAIQR